MMIECATFPSRRYLPALFADTLGVLGRRSPFFRSWGGVCGATRMSLVALRVLPVLPSGVLSVG